MMAFRFRLNCCRVCFLFLFFSFNSQTNNLIFGINIHSSQSAEAARFRVGIIYLLLTGGNSNRFMAVCQSISSYVDDEPVCHGDLTVDVNSNPYIHHKIMRISQNIETMNQSGQNKAGHTEG